MRRRTGAETLGMRNVMLAEKRVANYASVVGDDVIAELEQLARPLQGARVMHISSTAYGGGVAEMLHTLVPLMKSVGLDAQWRVIAGDEDFFAATQAMHNALQGMDLDLTLARRAAYVRANAANAASFEDEIDYIVVHDPQPALLRVLCGADRGTWIWRCHIDLTAANPIYWAYLRPFIQMYDAAIFSSPAYVKDDLHLDTIAIIPPAIDPLSPKNTPMSRQDVADIVSSCGVDSTRPTLTQVSRFDPWKDPLGVIDVYRSVKRECPALQLVLIGSMADDDPEGMEYYQRTVDYADADPDIHVLSNLDGVGDAEVNAFQRQATVIVQKSLREGFGLTVAEGLWKAKPVIGGNAGGIPLQIRDGVNGYLVDDVEQCSARVLELLEDPARARKLGECGRTVVGHKFLSTAHLRSYLKLFTALAQPVTALRDASIAQVGAMSLPAPSVEVR